jgi:hypothetical protein
VANADDAAMFRNPLRYGDSPEWQFAPPSLSEAPGTKTIEPLVSGAVMSASADPQNVGDGLCVSADSELPGRVRRFWKRIKICFLAK